MSDLKSKLKNANTLNQVIQTVNQEYNLDQPLGIMSKVIVVEGLSSLIDKLRIPKRTNLKR